MPIIVGNTHNVINTLYIETGLLDITTIVTKNRLNMEKKLHTHPEKLTSKIMELNTKYGWKDTTINKLVKHVKFINKPLIKTYHPDQPPRKVGKPTHRGERNHRKINNLKILTINVRGIKSKLDSLEKTLHTLGTHIAGITETHLARGETINIPGYEWRGKERNNKEGGGIGFLIRKDIINITEDIEDLNPQS